MNDRLDLFRRRLEKLLCDDEESIVENQICATSRRAPRWLLCYLLPVLFLALIINVTFMFVAPVEIIMSGWFWLKDPISIVVAFAVVKTVRYFFSRGKDHV